jgi:hypothetical protein
MESALRSCGGGTQEPAATLPLRQLNRWPRLGIRESRSSNVLMRVREGRTLMPARRWCKNHYEGRHRAALLDCRTPHSAALSLHRARIHTAPRANVTLPIHPPPHSNTFRRSVRPEEPKLAAARLASLLSAGCRNGTSRTQLPQGMKGAQSPRLRETVSLARPSPTASLTVLVPARLWLCYSQTHCRPPKCDCPRRGTLRTGTARAPSTPARQQLVPPRTTPTAVSW